MTPFLASWLLIAAGITAAGLAITDRAPAWMFLAALAACCTGLVAAATVVVG